MEGTNRCGIALGSNLGDRLAHLQAARDAILALSCVDLPLRQSPVYETDPVDCPPGSPAFLNAVIEVAVSATPAEFLAQTQTIERDLGRMRFGIRNEARVVDVDLLYLGDLMVGTGPLTLPHPRLAKRLFVLQPLQDIRPDLILPGQTATVRSLCGLVSCEAEPVCPFTSAW